MNKKMSLFILLLFVAFNTDAQKQGQAKIDSLLSVLPSLKEDSNKVLAIHAVSFTYQQINPKEGLKYAEQELALAEKIGWKKGIAKGNSSIAGSYTMMGDYYESLKFQANCYQTYSELNDNEGMAKSRINTGLVYGRMADYPKALEYFFMALKLFEESNAKDFGNVYGNIANVYKEQKDYNKALSYTLKGLQMAESTNNKQAIAECYGTLATIYAQQEDYKMALINHNKALQINLERGSIRNIAGSYSGLATVYAATGDNDMALDYFNKALEISRQMNGKYEMAYSFNNLGSAYLKISENGNSKLKMSKQKLLQLSKQYFDSALIIANQIGELKAILTCYDNLSKIYTSQNDYQNAFNAYKNYTAVKDSIFNTEKEKKLTQTAMRYEYEKKEAILNAQHEKEMAVAKSEAQKQKVIRNSSVAGAMGVVMFLGFAFYNFQRRRQLEKMQALANERLRISRELHDDVGSALGSIALYSDVAITRSIKKESSSDVLLKIGNASRDLVERMSDIIWSMNPENENTEKLITRMKGFANSMLTPMKVNVQYDINDELKTLKLTGDQMKNIFLIFKEAVYNIAKYADCRNAKIELAQTDGKIVMNINDDGKGFDTTATDTTYNGNGLKNMQARTAMLQGNICIQSKLNGGTKVELKVPLL